MHIIPSMPVLCAAILALEAAVPAARAQSLWTAPGSTERSLFSDRKAGRPGDILTIVVAESAAQSSTQSKKTSNGSSVDASISRFLFPKGLAHRGEAPSIGYSSSSDFSGGGVVNNSQAITARAAVVVTDVLPNGNCVVEGARRVTFSGETQHILLRGVVRPDDIQPDNTLLSSCIADAKVEFLSEGELTDARRRGWMGRLWDFMRPF